MPLATLTFHKRVKANTILARQGTPCKLLYFIQNGRFKVIRNVQAVTGDRHSNEEFYEEPSKDDLKNENVRNILLEITEIGRYQCFGEYNLTAAKEVEPFTVISITPCEVFFVERTKFCEFLAKSAFETFIKNMREYPSDTQIRRFYYESISWRDFKDRFLNRG